MFYSKPNIFALYAFSCCCHELTSIARTVIIVAQWLEILYIQCHNMFGTVFTKCYIFLSRITILVCSLNIVRSHKWWYKIKWIYFTIKYILKQNNKLQSYYIFFYLYDKLYNISIFALLLLLMNWNETKIFYCHKRVLEWYKNRHEI